MMYRTINKSRKLGFKLLTAIVVGLLLGTVAMPLHHASALTGANFSAGHIIDDVVFTNSSSMTVEAIQDFLNAELPNCDTSGAASYSYYYNSFTGEVDVSSTGTWTTSTRAVYGQRYANFWNNHTSNSAGHQRSATYMFNESVTPYVCLPQYTEGGLSAAQIIYNAAQQYQINPQVLIVTLQKEQGLVTDNWPWLNEYEIAMGYACPDTAPCNSQYYGFTNQIYNAAAQYRRYLTTPTNYNYVVGNNNILFAPGCSSGPVSIQNQATAALYDYTPYQPNQNVLNGTNPTGSSSGPGTASGSCNTYGNRNFWWYFNSWFGSSLGIPRDAEIISSANTSPWLQFNDTATVTVTVENIGTETWCADGSCVNGQLPTRLVSDGFAPFSMYDSSDPSWASPSQVKMQTATVAPGATGVFSFRVKAPYAVNAISNRFYLMVDSTAFVSRANVWVGAHSIMPPAPTLVSQTQQAATTVLPGQETTATVTLKNNSDATWYNEANATGGNKPFRLAVPGYQASPYYDKKDPAWLTASQIAMQTATVAPGQNGVFQFKLLGPLKSTTAALKLIPVIDGGSALQDVGISLNLNTPLPSLSYSFVSASFPPASTTAGTVSSTPATISLKNTGNTVWRNDASGYPNPTRLMMIFPTYRSSAFYNSADPAWLVPSQIALQTAEVDPGQTGVFSFNWTAPAKPATYLEYFSMVTDGYGFFPFYGSAWQTVVH